jgi:hypothetical protein
MRLQAIPVPLGHDMTSSRFAGELASSDSPKDSQEGEEKSHPLNKHPTNPTTPHIASPRSSAPRPQPATFVFPDSIPSRLSLGPVLRTGHAHHLSLVRTWAVTRRSACLLLVLIHQATKTTKTTKHAAITASPQYLARNVVYYDTSLRTARRSPTAHLSQLKLPNPLQKHLSPALPHQTSPPRQPCPILADQDHNATEPRFFACRRHTLDSPCSTLPVRPSPLDASQPLTKSRTEPQQTQQYACCADGPPTVHTRRTARRFAQPSRPVIPFAGS